MHYYSVLNRLRTLAELTLHDNDAQVVYNRLNNLTLPLSNTQTTTIKVVPQQDMKTIMITNLPQMISEKDLFLILHRITTATASDPSANGGGLRRILLADEPSIRGLTQGIAVVTYKSHESARTTLELLKTAHNNEILGKKVSPSWKEPNYDVIAELALETRVLYVKKLSKDTTIDTLKVILSRFGRVLRLKKQADRVYVEFDTVANARNAYDNLNMQKVDGAVWECYPAKLYDEDKAKDVAYNNIIFSKGFLDEYDQHMLLKFVYDGQFPSVNPGVLEKASYIVKAAKKYQVDMLEQLQKTQQALNGGVGNTNAQVVEQKQQQQYSANTENVSPNIAQVVVPSAPLTITPPIAMTSTFMSVATKTPTTNSATLAPTPAVAAVITHPTSMAVEPQQAPTTVVVNPTTGQTSEQPQPISKRKLRKMKKQEKILRKQQRQLEEQQQQNPTNGGSNTPAVGGGGGRPVLTPLISTNKAMYNNNNNANSNMGGAGDLLMTKSNNISTINSPYLQRTIPPTISPTAGTIVGGSMFRTTPSL